VGGYLTNDIYGLWFMFEGIYWKKGEYEPTNFGIGITAKGDYGETRDGKYDPWASLALGPNFDYWTELRMGLDHVLVKARPMYRWKKDCSNGLMPALYLEYNHSFGFNDTGLIAFDGQYFPGDSYASLSFLLDHRIDENLKVKGGVVFTENFSSGANAFGFGPTISMKINNRWFIGISANILENWSIGLFCGYDWNSEWRDQDANEREESISVDRPGKTGIDLTKISETSVSGKKTMEVTL
jgi:hypothetical protein